MTMNSDKKVCIIDYGSGNARSVYNIFQSIHPFVKLSCMPDDIEDATHLVLPGVGAFGATMEKLKTLSILGILEKNVLKDKKHFLGICVGMQILAGEGMEHGVYKGLGWIPGTVKIIDTRGLCLPHVGWNNFKMRRDNALLEGINQGTDFYYVHSYQFEASDTKDVVATCEYGVEFAAIINVENIYGVQFHPEKSQKAGKRLLQNFMRLT